MKRQAEREGGQLLILPSVDTEEAGALSGRPSGSASESKDNIKPTEKSADEIDRYRKGQSESTAVANTETIKAVASDLQQQFGVEVEVIDSPDNIPNATARKAIAAGQNVKGWYDVKTGKVYLYAPT